MSNTHNAVSLATKKFIFFRLRYQIGYVYVDRLQSTLADKIEMLTIDAEKIILDFGGVKKVTRALKEVGHPRTAHAVRNWVRRNNIPIDSVLTLAYIARGNNQRFDLLDYVATKEKDNDA